MLKRKRALITGITGQDGSYLTELLLSKDYEVHGIIRRASTFNIQRIEKLYKDSHIKDARLFLHYGDMTDPFSLKNIIDKSRPDEIYSLAAQSHVRVSFDSPLYTADVDALGVLRLLEIVKEHNKQYKTNIKIYQASSSEMFGKVLETPQKETTPFYPRSPYGCAKVYAHHQCVNYRESYGMFIANGILFNHTSPRRGETFVTRKITRNAARIKMGLQDKLYLGNLDAKRDWTFAGDAVEAMWLMLQKDTPADYVIASGQTHSIKEFLDIVFNILKLDWKKYVEIDERYYRPAEVDVLVGDASKAKKELRWAPRVSFEELATIMTFYDLDLATKEKNGLFYSFER